MYIYIYIYIFRDICYCFGVDYSSFDDLETFITPSTQQAAAEDVIHRILPSRAVDFIVKISPLMKPTNRQSFTVIIYIIYWIIGSGLLFVLGLRMSEWDICCSISSE